MKVLFLKAYYKPEIVASQHLFDDLCIDLINKGFDIELYAPTPTRGISKEVRAEYSKKRRYESKFDDHLIINRLLIPIERKNPIIRATRYIWMNIVFICCAIKSDADLIFLYSTPPTQGAMGALLRKIKKTPVIYNLQDIFPDSLVNTGLTDEGSLLFKIGRMVENFTYRNVDKIIAISEDFKKNIMAKGVPEEKIEIVPNWIDENEVIPIYKDNNILFHKFNLPKEKFYVSYCGNIGLTQNMDMLVEVAKDLESNSDIMFLIIGDGAYKPELGKKIKEKELKNIILLPFQPYEDIAYVFSIGDVGLVISKANVAQNSVPSKTWSIMSAGRPVLASFDTESELHRIIENAQCGVCVESDEKDPLINAILWLYENKEKRIQMGENGRDFILNNLTKKAGTGKMIDIIEKIINEHRK